MTVFGEYWTLFWRRSVEVEFYDCELIQSARESNVVRERIVSTEKKKEYCEWVERMELYCWIVFYVCFDNEMSEWVMIEAECHTQEWR